MLAGVFVTAFYTFRMLFLTFHGAERFDTAAATRTTTRHAARRIAAHGTTHDAGAEPDAHAHDGGTAARSRRGS